MADPLGLMDGQDPLGLLDPDIENMPQSSRTPRRRAAGGASFETPASLASAFAMGARRSTGVQQVAGYEPKQITDTGTADRLAESAGRIWGDIPAMAGGAAVGALASPAGSMVGMFAAPAGLAKYQEKLYNEGRPETAMDNVKFGYDVAKETAKGAVTGLATWGAGKVAVPLAKAAGATKLGQTLAKDVAEIGAMATAPAAMEGRAPSGQEIMDNVLLLGAMKGVSAGLGAFGRTKSIDNNNVAATLKEGLKAGKINIDDIKQTRAKMPDNHPQASILDTIILEHEKPVMESVRRGMEMAEAAKMPEKATVVGEGFTARSTPETQRRPYVDRRENRQTTNLPSTEVFYPTGRAEGAPQVENVISRHQTEASAAKKMAMEQRKNPGMQYRVGMFRGKFVVLGSEKAKETAPVEPAPATTGGAVTAKRPYREGPAILGQEPQGTELLTPQEKLTAAQSKPGFMRTAEDQVALTKAQQEAPPVLLGANGKPFRTEKSAEKYQKAQGINPEINPVIEIPGGFGISNKKIGAEIETAPKTPQVESQPAERPNAPTEALEAKGVEAGEEATPQRQPWDMSAQEFADAYRSLGEAKDLDPADVDAALDRVTALARKLNPDIIHGDWKTLKDLTARDASTKTTAKDLKALEEMGYVQTAFDKEGVTYYARTDAVQPDHLMGEGTLPWGEEPKGGGSVTLGSGLGGLQPYLDRIGKKLSGTQDPADLLAELSGSKSARETSGQVSAVLDRYSDVHPLRSLENIGKGLARIVQVRPQEILKKYAPKAGNDALKLNNAVVRRQRMRKGSWETEYWDAMNQLTHADRSWIEDNFKTAYEKGGADAAYPNPRVQRFARMWADVSNNVVTLAKDLGVRERYETDKWAVFKGENKRQSRVFASKKEADAWVREQTESDLYTVVDTGEKITKTRPITARKNYFPHVLTEEAQEALRLKNDAFMALQEECKIRGIDIEALAEEYRPSDRARRYGSLENARMADLPDFVMVKGKRVPILETNPYKVIQDHINRAANRLGIIEVFGQESGAKVFDELYNQIARESQDVKVADQWMWMWQKLNGTARDAFSEGRKVAPEMFDLMGSMENYARAAQLSAATILNVITGPVPISVRYGTLRTTKAIMRVGADSVARRLGVKLPMTEEMHRQLRVYAEMGGHSKEAMHVTTGTTDINSRIANAIMRGYGMNAINVFLNKVANHAAHGALMDALSSLKSGTKDGALRKMWGMDSKGLTEFMKREGDFTDADIKRMLENGPTAEDIAGIVQKSSTITNLFEEGGATLPSSMANGWARRLLAYTSWFRIMGSTLADTARYAKEGNVRPLMTLLVGAPLTGYVADAVRDYLAGKITKDETFFEKAFDLVCNSGLAGVAGTVGENVKWAIRTGDAPLGMPLYGWWWKLTAGMIKAGGQAMEGNQDKALQTAYSTMIKNIPIARIIDNVLGGPYSQYLDAKYGGEGSGRASRPARLSRTER